MKGKMLKVVFAAVFFVAAAASIFAQQNKAVELSADTIEYDSVKGVMTAQGNVRLVQDNAVMTGTNAEYNAKSKEAHVYGGVKVVQDDAVLTASEVYAYDNQHVVAQGQPVLVKGDNRLTGPKIEYDTDKQYALVPGGAEMTTADGKITAQQIEAYFQEDKAVAQGNAHITSDTRHLDATSDQVEYYGKKGGSKAVLTGNARAVQDGNVLTGNVLTIFMNDKQVDAEGRSKLIITPKE